MSARLKLRIELVPATCWRKNLRTQMKESQWKKLRKEVCEKQGNVCCICGSDYRLNCHEVWSYDDLRHIQKLTGFEAVCGMCHQLTHFGLAEILAGQNQLDLEAVIQHFLTVNGVDRDAFNAHKKEASKIYNERSKHYWHLDLGEWASLVNQKPLP